MKKKKDTEGTLEKMSGWYEQSKEKVRRHNICLETYYVFIDSTNTC